jgi:hypothetical protein
MKLYKITYTQVERLRFGFLKIKDIPVKGEIIG